MVGLGRGRMKGRSRCSAILFLGTVAFGACDDGQPGPPGVEVGDSAGVRMVSFRAADLPLAWRLADPAELEIAGGEEGRSFQLYRVTDALALTSGLVVLANAGNNELLFFEAAGGLVGRGGGEGSGPGEFRSLTWLARLAADSVAAYDRGLRRVSIFDATGRYARTITTAGTGPPARRASSAAPDVLGLLGDGSLVAAAYDQPAPVVGLVRPPLTVLRFSGDAADPQVIGTWPGSELHLIPEGGRLSVTTPPLARTTSIAVAVDAIWLADGEHWQVRGISPEGVPRTIVRRDSAGVRLTDDLIERILASGLDDVPAAERERWIAERRALLTHTTAPAISGLRIGDDGRVWVREERFDDGGVVAWTALSPDGRPLGRLLLPPAIEALRFAADAVFVKTTDSLGRETIRRYRMVTN